MFSIFPWRHSGPPPLIHDTSEQTKCDICGSKAVHWRLFDGSYKLADDQRQHPGNRYVQHRCLTSADGFEEVTDA